MPQTQPWIRSTWSDAGQVAAIADPDAPPELASGQALHIWYAGLVEAQALSAALEFMAQAMSRYDCIAWAARAAIATGVIDRTDPMLVTALQWIDNPDDSLRRAAGTAADAATKDTPAKLLCLAVWFSGGSLTPEDLAPVQPPADVCARLAAASLLVGAYGQADPDATLRHILELGEEMVTAQ